MKEVMNNPKTLYYAIPSSQIGQTPSQKALGDQTFAIRMDDAVYGIGTLGLQKDSEFLQIFNHYILKAIESGCFKRQYHNHLMALYTKENFEMMEAQPLGYENVMFCFICLAVGIFASLFQGMMEFMMKRLAKSGMRGLISTAQGRIRIR